MQRGSQRVLVSRPAPHSSAWDTGPVTYPSGQDPTAPRGSDAGPPRYVDPQRAVAPSLQPATQHATQPATQQATVPAQTRWQRVQAQLWPTRLEIRAAVALIAVLAALALLVGAVWEVIAPRLEFEVLSKGSAYQIDIESEALVAADGWFAIIGAALGLGTGVAVWFWRRVRGPFMLVALAGGSLLAAYIAWKFGAFLGRHPTASEARDLLNQVGAQVDQRLDLRARVVLLFQPAAAVMGYLLCVGISGRDDLGHEADERAELAPPGMDRVESRP